MVQHQNFMIAQTLFHVCMAWSILDHPRGGLFDKTNEFSHGDLGQVDNFIWFQFVISIAYYLFLLRFDPHGKEFIMRIHHISAIFTLSYAIYSGYMNIGSLVTLASDISDVPMFIMRILRHNDYSLSFQIPACVLTIIAWHHLRVMYFYKVSSSLYSNNAPFFTYGTIYIFWVMSVYWWMLLMYKAVKTLVYKETKSFD
jgi:hypothetical protein